MIFVNVRLCGRILEKKRYLYSFHKSSKHKNLMGREHTLYDIRVWVVTLNDNDHNSIKVAMECNI